LFLQIISEARVAWEIEYARPIAHPQGRRAARIESTLR
jgi:hypothetical protein